MYHLSSARTVYQLLQLSADGKTRDIKEMIQSGVNINSVDYDKRSALHLAAAEGRFDTVKFLVERGANVNAVDRFGGTPLRDALEAKRYDISAFLRSHGSTLGERSDFLVQKVCHAASEGNVLLLENVFENSFLSIDASDYDNRSPLHLAAACNHKKACEYLLRKGANPRALDRFGNTAIEEAMRFFFFFFLILFFCLFVLFCFVLFCFVLFCFVLFCFVLFCFVLFCFVLFCFVLFCFVLFCFVLFCFVLFCFCFFVLFLFWFCFLVFSFFFSFLFSFFFFLFSFFFFLFSFFFFLFSFFFFLFSFFFFLFSFFFFFFSPPPPPNREGHPELSKFIEEYDPKDNSEEKDNDDSSEEEVDEEEILSDEEDDNLTPKERCYRSAVVVFIQSFFSHVLEEKQEEDFSFSAGGEDEEISSLERVERALSENAELFKDLYSQFRKKFQLHSIDDELDESLHSQISSLAPSDRTILNYFLLFNEECSETNFFDDVKEQTLFHFSTNFFLSKQKNPPKAEGHNIRLQFDFL